jgi:hypothetical protein
LIDRAILVSVMEDVEDVCPYALHILRHTRTTNEP